MPLINRDALLAEDKIEAEEGLPFRFAANIDVNSDMKNSGKWTELKNGDRFWQLEIYSQGARSISLNYNKFKIPKGATYYIYNPQDTAKILGAFTSLNNKENKNYATGMILSNRIVLEYYEPKGVEYRGDISISSIAHGYKNVVKHIEEYSDSGPQKGWGDSEDCQNNINCPEWSEWQDVMKSVAMVVTSGGERMCSGALINNANEDEKHFFLTAGHCLDGTEDTWMFYFRYEQALCDSAYDGNIYSTVTSANVLASGELRDGEFALLELTPTSGSIPTEYDIYYAGWSNLSTAPDSTISIHHPAGDVKKISIDRTTPSTGIGGVWSTTYYPADSGTGLIEGGSSGGPLFDPSKRIIGQVFGGIEPDSACYIPNTTMSATFGKFSNSWDAYTLDSTTYLKYWLDPSNTGITTLDGVYPNASCCIPPMRGNIDYDIADSIDISDLVYMVYYMFAQGYPPPCEEEADVDGSTEIDISDLIILTEYMFNSGPALANCP